MAPTPFDANDLGNAIGQRLGEALEAELAPYPACRDTAHAALTAAMVVSGHVLAWATEALEDEDRLTILEEFDANVERTTHVLLQVRRAATQEDD
jgi:hypothetical protein